MDPLFFDEPLVRQSNFWNFGLLKLVRPAGFFTLHGAGLVPPEGEGILVIGPSGSGKSTLSLGLIRQGWRYLSDDALLLHSHSSCVEALALRRNFYIDSSAISKNKDLPLDPAIIDNAGGEKHRVRFEQTSFVHQQVSRCIPNVLLRTRIVPEAHSELLPITNQVALKELLEAGEVLNDRPADNGEH